MLSLDEIKCLPLKGLQSYLVMMPCFTPDSSASEGQTDLHRSQVNTLAAPVGKQQWSTAPAR
jgi:hypothetical protein